MLCGSKLRAALSSHLRRHSSAFSLPLRRFSSTVTATMASNNHPKDESYLNQVIPKRIQLFQSIQAKLLTECLSLSSDPIKITLPDGTVKEGKKWVTSPLDVAREISKSLAANALISEVNGVLWDMSRPLESDCELKLFTFESDEGRDTFWHSSAHILGQSLEQEYGCKLCIGPCTTRGEESGYFPPLVSHLQVSSLQGEHGHTGGLRSDRKDAWHPAMLRKDFFLASSWETGLQSHCDVKLVARLGACIIVGPYEYN
ncbi:threonine--tRNA ligase, mitochondrial 1-like isoform X2 [Quercus lobata]|uniref:threonine--tRNA ligase, mitochondrial 1-like isoform X2 n=1 Tax=Quercus lobata TaxID=97700 RepID=UPI00124422DA|nr:threonine--tRNA ligase, mitochondrial 1-like isoform X2 [Quercus lobata]